jgi:hypothetical protein
MEQRPWGRVNHSLESSGAVSLCSYGFVAGLAYVPAVAHLTLSRVTSLL